MGRIECLGRSCRLYQNELNAVCFKQGVLPACSPDLKARRIRLEASALDLYGACTTFQVAMAIWRLDPTKAPHTLTAIFDETIGKALAEAEDK